MSHVRWSLSARRAWIEIEVRHKVRNRPEMSLSARRAWIEIAGQAQATGRQRVALRKESVDRNSLLII